MPSDTCLAVIEKNGSFLLIAKRRGLGRGLLNFPGGKVEENEEPTGCAVRETMEEVKVRIKGLEKLGEIVFDHGELERVHVFLAEQIEGMPEETEEAVPFWLPYLPENNTWPDDVVWFTYVVLRKRFKCFFKFSDDWSEYYGGYCEVE